MLTFFEKQKKYQEKLNQKAVLDHQMEAITNCLIGAIGLGKKVEKINYNKEDLLKLDLKFHIELFKESNETVEDLEKTLTALYIKIINVKFDLEQELLDFIELYNKKRELFLFKYIYIPIDFGEITNESKQIMVDKIKENDTSPYVFFSDKKGIVIFSDKNNDFTNILEEVKLYLPNKKCIIQTIETNTEYEFFIPLLLNKEP